MPAVRLSCPEKNIFGKIKLSGSKSISNRVLLIRSLCSGNFKIDNLSDSDDTTTLKNLLESKDSVLDAHHAGTTYRFLTAFLALTGREAILTGSLRMKERPIGPLVDVLRMMGASIEYSENAGFPPIHIKSPTGQPPAEISLTANISSQYISAIIMIAPILPQGLTIQLEGEVVSRPYIEMTIGIMRHFGVKVEWNQKIIVIKPQKYIPKDFFVEADWSAASYYYAIAAASDNAEIRLEGLMSQSLQGDAAIVEIGKKFGVTTEFENQAIVIKKSGIFKSPVFFEYDFINQPDIMQSISVLAGILGTQCIFSGLQTLRIKETDRIAALQNELGKFQVYLSAIPKKFAQKTDKELFMQEGKAFSEDETKSIDTYNDHRMAMSFAALSMSFPIIIKDANVVSKSYPKFWSDLNTIGFNTVIIEE